jgi:hypothetical protein
MVIRATTHDAAGALVLLVWRWLLVLLLLMLWCLFRGRRFLDVLAVLLLV